MTKKTRKKAKRAPARKPARKPARRPKPVTAFTLKELAEHHVEALRQQFGEIRAHEWRLVVDAAGRPIRPAPAATTSQAAPPSDTSGTTLVLFAISVPTKVAADGG